MADQSRPSTSYTTPNHKAAVSTSCLYQNDSTTTSHPKTGQSSVRPSTSRPRTGISTLNNQEIVCATIESRGVSPTVGIALLNLYSGEAFLCQIADTQSYVQTIHKLVMYEPSKILVPDSGPHVVSKLNTCIQENLGDRCSLIPIDRRYFSEDSGLEFIQQLAFAEDVEALKVSLIKKYFAVCCFSAVIRYVDVVLSTRFPFHSLRVLYQPSEGSVMIDVSTIHSLELIQNLEVAKSKNCFFGLLNHTLTPMGARYLRTNILQPSTDPDKINARLDAVNELFTSQEMFLSIRAALKSFVDAEKVLTDLITIPNKPSAWYREQAVNRVIMLKQFVMTVPSIHDALLYARSDLLVTIRELCALPSIETVRNSIHFVVNDDITFAKTPLEFRYQRNYAIKSGLDGMTDITRQAFKEAQDDAYNHVRGLSDEFGLPLEMKFEVARQFYIRVPISSVPEEGLPPLFTHVVKRRGNTEFQTLDLMKLNQKLRDCELEILDQCQETVDQLINDIHEHMSGLYKCCESIALLDMLTSFAHLAACQEYIRPEISETLAIKDGRHPVKERFQEQNFVPNDVYATQQSRFQIITGCNMSGKSTYIRSVALINMMMQIGSFVPATHASLPIIQQLFARTSVDDSIEANASTFSLEMREMAFILRNIDQHSLVIIDELGRGTSLRDGLSIAIAVSEALIESRARVWFATHFKDLVAILCERPGVLALHMGVNIAEDMSAMTMLYRISQGAERHGHYGIAMARVYPFPTDVIHTAEHVSKTLQVLVQQRKKSSAAFVNLKKRKVLLSLKEHLEQAKNGHLEGEALRVWLLELQKEFINRMEAIEEEARGRRWLAVEGEEEE